MNRFLSLLKSGLIFLKAKIFMFIFGFFSIDNNKIFVSNFDGKGYGENPAAVCDELLKRNIDLKIYWVVNNINDTSIPKEIIKVKNNSIKYFYHLRTAKVWLKNKRSNIEITKRKDQYYIQLWHGPIGMKKIEKDCEKTLNKFYVKAAKKDSKYIDLMISNSNHFTNVCKNSFWYSGRVEKYGTPKNDILINTKEHNKIIKNIKDEFNIKNEKILLYAPTFRDDHSMDAYDIDLERIQKELKKIYNQDYIILVRMHPNVSELNLSKLITNKKIINVSKYPEINDLLIASDILISDYSSIMFDYALMKKKVFLYISDLKNNNRGFYFNIDELPFSLATNTSELLKDIKNFDNEKYLKKLNNFYNKLELFEDGKASERVADIIIKVVGGKIGKE